MNSLECLSGLRRCLCFPSVRGYSLSWSAPSFCLYWWHPSCQPKWSITQNPLSPVALATSGTRPCHQRDHVWIWLLLHWFSWSLANNVEAKATFRQTATVKGRHSFVCMVNFYRWFIPSAARIMVPFSLGYQEKPVAPNSWFGQMYYKLKALQHAKAALVKSTMLNHQWKEAQQHYPQMHQVKL